MTTTGTSLPTTGPRITCDQALLVARADAEQAYRDLSDYRIVIVLADDGWHVDYELTQPLMAGGGPHYVIDATSGTILKKHYYQ